MRENNIILTGLSGCGKTSLGKGLASTLGRGFIDLDKLIIQNAGMEIQDIFNKRGEVFFRELETGAIKSLEGKRDLIVSTGGGAVLKAENVALLYGLGQIIFIDRPPEAIAGDIDIEGRPLLKGGADEIYRLSRERREIYLQTADRVLENNTSADEALEALIEHVKPITHMVIGDPISHSKSPDIHNRLFADRGLKYRYGCMRIPPYKLSDFAQWVRTSPIMGFNVTIPHKTAIIPLLDYVDEGASKCGAVNTVVREGSTLRGYNTDMGGLSLAIEKKGHSLHNSRVIILGAGGASRAAQAQAGLSGAKSVTVLRRDEIYSASMKNADILINATPLGMETYSEDFKSLHFLESFPKSGLVLDMVYTPPRTRLLEKAEELGITGTGGIDMLNFQAELAQGLFA